MQGFDASARAVATAMSLFDLARMGSVAKLELAALSPRSPSASLRFVLAQWVLNPNDDSNSYTMSKTNKALC